jgi:hypothetical protein
MRRSLASRSMAAKMGIPFEDALLLAPGLQIELCFRRYVVPPRRTKVYKALGEDVLAIHFALRLALW